jgi:hypothetical protein
MTASPIHHGSPAARIPADPGALVGRKIRRRAIADSNYTPWAQIVMTVPSRDGLCWMVTFIDGDLDV